MDYLLAPCLNVGHIAIRFIIGKGGREIFMGCPPVFPEHIAEAKSVKSIGSLGWLAQHKRFLVKGYGIFIIAHIEMTLRISIVINIPFLRSESRQIGQYLVKILSSFLEIPFMIIAESDISLEPVVKPITLVKLLEEQQ